MVLRISGSGTAGLRGELLHRERIVVIGEENAEEHIHQRRFGIDEIECVGWRLVRARCRAFRRETWPVRGCTQSCSAPLVALIGGQNGAQIGGQQAA